MTNSYCGFITLVGRPNVGKSTLLNRLLGKKVSITSHKPQTTRQNLYGIKTQNNRQAVFIDTPGIHKHSKRKLNQWMNKQALASLEDVDVCGFLIEAGSWTEEDQAVLEALPQTASVLLIINKIDMLKNKEDLLPFMQRISQKFPFKEVIPLSAFCGDNLSLLEKVIFQLLPENPFYFPEDMVCSHNTQYQMTEIVREKILRQIDKEVPYSTSVQIEHMEHKENYIEIHALIWVEREGQKRILIGSKGENLKSIGTHARRDIERLTQKKVLLKLWVKIKEGWADNEKMLVQLGYVNEF